MLPATKPRLASAALQGQDKKALRAPNRASYPSCGDGTPKLRATVYPEQASIANMWFVYLLALTDCSAFKVGFSCNPFQRIHTFSHRYYERFDVAQSLLLRLDTEAQARAIEATLKSELAVFRTDSPTWVPLEAGGQTEWFSAVQFGTAEQRLRSFLTGHEASQVIEVGTYIRDELQRLCGSFEPWAWSQAQLACDASASAYTLRSALAIADSLRDWLEGYRFFDVPLFSDDPAALEFVWSIARRSPNPQPQRARVS
jgi:hypothetical protein